MESTNCGVKISEILVQDDKVKSVWYERENSISYFVYTISYRCTNYERLLERESNRGRNSMSFTVIHLYKVSF